MLCQDALPMLAGAMASALAKGRGDEELALLAALFFTAWRQPCGDPCAARGGEYRCGEHSVLSGIGGIFAAFSARHGDEHARKQRDGRAEQDTRRERFI